MSVCAKFQLPSLSRRGLKVCGSGVGWLAVSTMSNLNQSWIELELGLGFDNKNLDKGSARIFYLFVGNQLSYVENRQLQLSYPKS